MRQRRRSMPLCLMENHFHLLLRRGGTEIATVMRRLLTAYAVRHNRRHKRSGHLFQNRYKAIICQDEPYFLELVRYIHLNPIRAGLCSSMAALKTYPYSGHSYLMGKSASEWFEPDAVLSHFAKTKARARRAYLEFLNDGLSMGKRDDLVGGGLKRSLGYPKKYPKTKQAFDDRILGEGSFVESVLGLCKAHPVRATSSDFKQILSSVCEKFGVSEAALLGKSRKASISDARAHLAHLMESELGLSPTVIAERLSISTPGALKAIARGKLLAGTSEE